MMTCNNVREMLALQPLIEDPAIEMHLDQCDACTKYRRQHQALDVMLRAELHWEAPAALTQRLLALVAVPAKESQLPIASPRPLMQPRAPIAPMRPQAWFVTSVYVLTMVIVALSLLVAWQVIGSLTSQIEVGALLTQLLALPAQGLAYTRSCPNRASRSISSCACACNCFGCCSLRCSGPCSIRSISRSASVGGRSRYRSQHRGSLNARCARGSRNGRVRCLE